MRSARTSFTGKWRLGDHGRSCKWKQPHDGAEPAAAAVPVSCPGWCRNRCHSHPVTVGRSRVVKNELAGGAEVRIRCSGSCYGAATAASGCCCTLWGWEPSCLPPTACPNTGCCSRAARWAAKEQKERINHTAFMLLNPGMEKLKQSEVQRRTFTNTLDRNCSVRTTEINATESGVQGKVRVVVLPQINIANMTNN